MSRLALLMLAIAFLDELVFGARQAAWPLIRDDLELDYLQISLILVTPNLVSGLVEPVIGILGDVWKRRLLVLAGGVVYFLALFLFAASAGFWSILFAFVLMYPASGAFVSLSQASLMDLHPQRREHNMARWTFAGSLGVVAGPLVLAGVLVAGLSWRAPFLLFALLTGSALWALRRLPMLRPAATPEADQQRDRPKAEAASARIGPSVLAGFRQALDALRRRDVVRLLTLLQFSDLMLDTLLGFLALYLVDVAGAQPAQAGLAVAVWTGAGLLGDFLLIPLLERVRGLWYLRLSAVLVLLLYPLFLLFQAWWPKLVLLGMLGLLNAGWYAILKGQLYHALPGRSGSVMTVSGLFGLVGQLLPLAVGFLAQSLGLGLAMWALVLGPLALVFGLPKPLADVHTGSS